MIKKRYTAVIFDMDGTLLYTIDDIAKSVNLTLGEFGYPLRTTEEVTSFVNNGSAKLIERSLPESARDEETISKVHERYIEIYSLHVCEKTRPYDGIKALVKKLGESGVKMAVVSNKPDILVKALCEKCFGKGVFDYSSGIGSGLPIKPGRECVDRAIKAMEVGREDVIYVGDSYVDVLTARNSEVFCAGVLWGFGGEKSFEKYEPDVKVSSTIELEKLILGE